MFIAVRTGPALAVVIVFFGRCESRPFGAVSGVGYTQTPAYRILHPYCMSIGKNGPRP